MEYKCSIYLILIPLYLCEIFGLKTPISTYTSTAAQHNISVIVLKVVPWERAVTSNMWVYQQVAMCTYVYDGICIIYYLYMYIYYLNEPIPVCSIISNEWT